MKYYKIVNQKGHHGLKYHEGLNTDPLPFNPSGDCEDGGIYFAREDILAFIGYGTELYEVEPVGKVYENPCEDGNLKKWKAHSVILKHIGKLDLGNIKLLVEDGADIHTNEYWLLQTSVENGHLDMVKYLVENGCDIHACYDCALRYAAAYGHLDIIKFILADGEKTNINWGLQWAADNGHLNVVKFMVEQGADVHINNNDVLKSFIILNNLEAIEYIKSLP